MTIKISTQNEYKEAFLIEDCDEREIYRIPQVLEAEFKLKFIKKLNALEIYYWDFIYQGCELTLHYTIYTGVSLFPTQLKTATVADNNAVINLSELLSKYLTNNDQIK